MSEHCMLGLCDCSYRAGRFARATAQASICIDYVLVVTFGDRANRALIYTRAAT